MTTFSPCVLIPTFDNPRTIEQVVAAAQEYLHDVLVVDDGSGPEAQPALEAVAARPGVHLLRRPVNSGKGVAMMEGFAEAKRLGYTHAVQVDADGQHDDADIPRFVEAAREAPDHLILGQPIFDDSAPTARLKGRRISIFWAAFQIGSDSIGDPLCGYRTYPVEASLRSGVRAKRMDFDPEIAVRMVWQGVPIRKLSTKVRYVPEEEGGVSHFSMLWDNIRISWAHTRLGFMAVVRMVFRRRVPLPGDRALP